MIDKKILMGLLLIITTSCTKKVWQCTTHIEGCPSYLMHSEDVDKSGIDSFWNAQEHRFIKEYVECK
jgi:hypothetical protein